MIRLRLSVARVLLAAALTGVVVPGTAYAVSLRDLMELSKAGLSDDVLVALVEAGDTVYNLDAPRILELRAAGVSERVIIAMLKKRPEPPPAVPDSAAAIVLEAPPPAAPPVQVIVQQPPPAAEPSRVVLVPWWPWQPVPQSPGVAVPPTTRGGFGRFMNDGWVERPGGARQRP